MIPSLNEAEDATKIQIARTLGTLRSSYRMLEATTPRHVREVRARLARLQGLLAELKAWEDEFMQPLEENKRIDRLKRFCTFCAEMEV